MPGDYGILKTTWQKYYSNKKDSKNKDDIVQFFLKTDPFLTIPPYQDNKNRKPPRCQSLILNPEYLDKNYSNWQKWVLELQKIDFVKSYLEDYEEELKNIKTSGFSKLQNQQIKQSFSYFSSDNSQKNKKINYQKDERYLKARILQFIFDRVKDNDPLSLNKIYSWCKKYRQHQSTSTEKKEAQKKLEKIIAKSKLPSSLKTKRDYQNDVFLDKNFLHLVCSYYKFRKKAKDGRIFIYPKYRYIKGQGYKNTGRFDDAHSLLTYCNRQPRHKRHQMLPDMASLLQISPQELKGFLKISDNTEADNAITTWLEGIKGLKTNCGKMAKEQKNRRGSLKIDIQEVYNLRSKYKKDEIKKDKKQFKDNFKFDKEFKAYLKSLDKTNKSDNKKDKKYDELYKLCEKAKELYLELTKDLYNKFKTEHWQAKWQNTLNKNPATAVYLLAQVNNLAFKDRSGNAKTCAVCSQDNAQRMQSFVVMSSSVVTSTSAIDSSSSVDLSSAIAPASAVIPAKAGIQKASYNNENSHITSKAGRLPAISTRIIDGAIMRLSRIVGRAIVDDKWQVIKSELEKGKKVCVPIITESNQFEFEPSREELVKGQRGGRSRTGSVLSLEKGRKKEEKLYTDKENRIKNANKDNICPYTGVKISSRGEIDHIIPRASKYGVLNDEANLIYTSKEGNQHKSNNYLTLKDLKSNYKKSLFPDCNNDKAIENWIIGKIGGSEDEGFKFGKYNSFINLNPDEQTAFRHALFVESLRTKVINTIDNKNRAFVNGTQRYFAQVIANNLYKKVLAHNANSQKSDSKNKKINIKNLTFDYFGVPSLSSSQNIGISGLRKRYEEQYCKVFKEYKKTGKEAQKPYSHLIDAQLAFCVAIDAHQKEGSLKLNIPKNRSIYPSEENNKQKNFEDTLLGQIYINNSLCKIVNLKRRKAYTVETHYRQQLQKQEKQNILISYQIHRDNMVSEKFIPLLKFQNGNLKKGFTIKNSVPFDKDISLLKPFLKKTQNKCSDYDVLIIDKQKAQNFLMKIGHEGSVSALNQKIAKILDELSYQTLKKEIASQLTIKDKKPQTVKEAIDNWDKCIKEGYFITKDKIILPLYNEWVALKKALKKANPLEDLQKFLKNNLFKNMHTNNKHNKVRQKFSLPIKIGIGNIRLKRYSWNDRNIIQVSSEESLAKYGYDGKERPHTMLSKNAIPIGHYSGIPQTLKPQPLKWINIPKKDITDKKILSAQVKNKDADRCLIKIKISNIDQLSVPKLLDNQYYWEGKIIQYSNQKSLNNSKKNTKSYHCLESKYKWFDFPFNLSKDRNKIIIRKEKIHNNKLIYNIEFTTQKNKNVKKWLLGK